MFDAMHVATCLQLVYEGRGKMEGECTGQRRAEVAPDIHSHSLARRQASKPGLTADAAETPYIEWPYIEWPVT